MEIIEVNNSKRWKQFLRFPFDLFKNDPLWVPPLLSEQKHLFNRDKNPFFKHCIYKAWLIIKEEEPAGRIVAFIDTLYNDIHKSATGFVGFFDCIDDQAVVENLFNVSAEWLRQNGAQRVCGPMNFSIGYECGVQLTGFDSPATIQMNYSPAYYRSLFENAGFEKEHDLYAYLMTDDEVRKREAFLKRLDDMGKKALAKEDVIFRILNLREYKKELRHIQVLYNDCMQNNWGFVPVNFEEMEYSSKSLKQIADKHLVYFAEVKGEVVGCSVSIPDVNQAVRHVKNGKLFPTGFIKLLYHLKRINGFRLIFIGVNKDHRFKGLDALFYYHTMRVALERSYRHAELSWISEDNHSLIKIVEKIGAVRYKTYRMYKKELGSC